MRLKRYVRMWVAAVAAVWVAGCANGSGVSSPTSPSPVAATNPTIPSSCALPGTPTNLSANVVGTKVSLSWSPVSDANDYVIVVGSSPMTEDVQMTGTTEPEFAFNDMEPGTRYARVHAHNWCGTGDPSESVAFTISR